MSPNIGCGVAFDVQRGSTAVSVADIPEFHKCISNVELLLWIVAVLSCLIGALLRCLTSVTAGGLDIVCELALLNGEVEHW